MGLDSYLEKSIYIGAEYDFNEVTGIVEISIKGKEVPINFNKINSIRESFMYWRKANAIHNWFVQNVQNGEDDCKEYYVSIEKLKELVLECKKVLLAKQMLSDEKLAKSLLPTQAGFFFGSTEYDEYYYQELQKTVNALENLDEDCDYYYSSSW